jgi:thiosulfate sulfurtransferase
MIKQIDIAEAKILIEQQNALIVDIRDPGSFSNGHIKNAVRIDNDNFQEFVDSADKSKPLIVCCYHGNSSQPATETFNHFGFNGHSLIGGMSLWAQSNPIESK